MVFHPNRILIEDIETFSELETLSASGRPLNMMMGQTFDEGQPVEMVKYALFMIDLSEKLRNLGAPVKCDWLLADHFMVDINQDKLVNEAKEQVKQRVAYLNKINEVYGGDIGAVLSSELSSRESYDRNLESLFLESERNPDFKKLVLNAVPEDRRGNPNALRYPFEELATIQTLDTNIKVGPPYEKFYDVPARAFASFVGFNKYVAIQLTKSFPFGNPLIKLEDSKSIEEFGILPYKKGSKGLGEFRLDPINGNCNSERDLILQTKDFRAIRDLVSYSLLAKERLSGETNQEVLKNLQDTQESRSLAFELYNEFIHKPIRSYQE
jgi:hypothetical protein